MVVISVYTYGVKIIKKFRWESGFLWGGSMEPPLCTNGSAGYLMQLSVNPVLDKKFGGREKTHVRARMSICNLINQLNLTDIWRDQHGNIRDYTWRSSSKPPILCRLDYF